MYKKLTIIVIVAMFAFAGCGLTDGDKESTEGTHNNTVTEQEQTGEPIDTESYIEEDTQDGLVQEEKEVTLYAQANVNIRSIPSTNGEKQGMLTTNQEVTGLGEAVDGWQKIRYNEKIAYVSVKYLSQTKIEVTK